MNTVKTRKTALVAELVAVVAALPVFVHGKVVPLYSDWEFRRDGEKTWKSVDVPHDWAIDGPFCETNDVQITKIVQDGEVSERRHTGRTGALPWPGKGWYRRALNIPAGTEYAELVFDGAMSEAVVFADGRKVGEWKNGYNAFIVEIPVTTKSVEVALDNPPASSRWYPGSGLIRPVRLVTGGATGIATWGNWIRTTALAADAATVEVTTRLRGATQDCRVEWTLRAPDGKIAATARASVSDAEVSGSLKVVSPQPWSPETPTLYRLETVLKKDAAVLDERNDRVGLRLAGFTRDGFFLNGKKRPFRGVCLHHDLGPIGAAFNASAFRRQVRLLKEFGADAIRTSHNMPAPDQMDICDEEGMMVMAESFDMWMTPKTPNDYARHFKAWWRRDLENLLLCHRSHPSLVMWSIGNEIHEKDTVAVRDIAKAMTEFCHRMDPTRPVLFVTDRPDDYTASGAIQVTDVPTLTYRLPRYEFMHAHSPIGLVLGGETASTFSSRGCYHFPDKVWVNAEHADGQSSSYDLEHGSWSNLPDDDWAMQDDHPWAIGEFVWTGFDYLGEPTPYKTYWPSRSSYFGLFDLAGIPKDRAWLYRCRWNTDAPTLHVLPHWTWPEREGQVTPVYVYTSYPEAELFVNGVSQGRRRRDPSSRLDRYRLRWRDVVYRPGALRVVAYDAQGRPAAEKTVRTAGKPAALKIEPEQKSIAASRCDGQGDARGCSFSCCGMPELGWFRVRVVDGEGNVCPRADNRIEVKVSGAAKFRGICNGDATSLESFTKPTMKVFNGELVVVVEAGQTSGDCLVTVAAEGLVGATVRVPVLAGAMGVAGADVAKAYVSKAEYLDLMEAAVSAYSDEHIEEYIEKTDREGVEEHGFPRLASNMGVLLANGRMPSKRETFRRMMDISCRDAAKGPMKKEGNDFSVKELVIALAAVERAGLYAKAVTDAWRADLTKVEATRCYRCLPPVGATRAYNWCVFGCASEQARLAEGVGGDPAHVEKYVSDQMRWFDANGMYRDPGQPSVYDLVTRLQFMAILYFGYKGPSRTALEAMLDKAAEPTLSMLSACGEIPYGGRSNQFLHNHTFYAAVCEWYAARFRAKGDEAQAVRFRLAAREAVDALREWLALRPMRHIKNHYPLEGMSRGSGIGCEGYAYFDKYMVTMGSWAMLGWMISDESLRVPTAQELDQAAHKPPLCFATTPDFHFVFLRAGDYSAQFDYNADWHYDCDGLGRIHRRGAPAAIFMSVPCAKKPGPGYKLEHPNMEAFSMMPVGVQKLVPVGCGQDADSAWAFWKAGEMDWKCRLTEKGLASTLTGPDRVALSLPAFAFDGASETEIVPDGQTLVIRYRGWACTYTTDGAIADTGKTFYNRNGRYRAFEARGDKSLKVDVAITAVQR